MPNIEIGQLPFYWRLATREEKVNSPVHSTYPFSFDINSELGLVIQRRDPRVLVALEKIYQLGHNIGYLQDANELARPYGTDFIRYLTDILKKNDNISKILEVGCGGCVVLADLKSRGYNVLGIDSSPFAAQQGAKKGVDVLTAFFPSDRLEGNYDLIFHVDVLEHIEDPISFLRHHYTKLNNNGLVVVNVPDATESIQLGDISMAMHQHLNYFTLDSLARTLQAAGLELVSVEKAKYGGSLYATGRRSDWSSQAKNTYAVDHQEAYRDFAAKAMQAVESMRSLIEEITSNTENTLGFYVPLRSLPYIATLTTHCDFRLFDDTTHWHHREFDGIDVAVENFSDLKARPVSHIIIMSLTFAETIRKKIYAAFGETIQVVTLSEVIRRINQ
jgi:trans-aconitate methyltransferase